MESLAANHLLTSFGNAAQSFWVNRRSSSKTLSKPIRIFHFCLFNHFGSNNHLEFHVNHPIDSLVTWPIYAFSLLDFVQLPIHAALRHFDRLLYENICCKRKDHSMKATTSHRVLYIERTLNSTTMNECVLRHRQHFVQIM